ncbi:MAG: thiol peroxidase [Thermodesulfobacteriota bacterium]
MQEREGLVTMKGNALTLLGPELKVGDQAPDFKVVDNDLNPVGLQEFQDKVLILSSVPSLDTDVCDMETRRFNNEAANLDSGIRILTISMDLPFAQKRWCGMAGVERVQTLSDYQQADFGQKYGVLIKDLRLLARAVFVLDSQRILRHVQLVPEIAQEPDYSTVLEAAKALVK